MSCEIIPFEESLLDGAGELLALRHRRCRRNQPFLPSRFEDPAAAREAISALWSREGASGVAALQGGKLQGYLMGETLLDNLWGRSAWIRFAGSALAPEQDPELIRDLYARIADPWVRWGCYTHFVQMPAAQCDPEATDGLSGLCSKWFALGFGIEQIYGIASLASLDLSRSPTSDIFIRRGEPGDRGLLEEMSDIIWRHQVQAPVWGIHLPERQAYFRGQYGALVDDPTATIWLAYYQGKAAGFHVYFREEPGADNLLVPDRCIELGVAATQVWARGKGVGTALTRHGFSQARDAGYDYCLTDWRSTNLLSSRFWPSQGFRPAMYRLARRIDTRIAWAGERSD